MVLATYGLGEALWTMFVFFIFFIWIMLLFQVFADIFRSDDLSGWGKAAWLIFVVFFVYLGVFVYLIARGHKMTEHQVAAAKAQQTAMDDYIKSTAGGGTSEAQELAHLAELHKAGTINDEEFAKMKAKIIG